MQKGDPQSDSIQIFGASQNNLKDVDLEIPGSQLTVITGVSGSGKSSIAFDTLYAEGQRRYVESLSAYARQFLERIPKPRIKDIKGIRPAIAIRQKNTTRNPRSTVGTVTEINDFLRLLYSRVGTIQCRECGRDVRKDDIDQSVDQVSRLPGGTRVLIAFPFQGSHLDLNAGNPEHETPVQGLVENLVKQGFHRLLEPVTAQISQLPFEMPESLEAMSASRVLVDRLALEPGLQDRLTDSLETCFAEGGGVAEAVVLPPTPSESVRVLRFTERFECQYCHLTYRTPEPALFSFNNPYGACPTCQGFGNTVGVDPELVIPDPGKTVAEGPVDPFTKPRYRGYQKKLVEFIADSGHDIHTAYQELPGKLRRKIWSGSGSFPGVKGFFDYLDRKKYKMHVRILISRYRGYTRCPDCGGDRLCEEARDVFLGGRCITDLTALPISKLAAFFENLELSEEQLQMASRLLPEIGRRLSFLMRVGLHYLSLERITSTLSGGEMQRIHLAASLGSSLVGTLYILDEPSIGLHPRDEQKLIAILRTLRDLGNTVVVVEHEREMIESADHIVDMGPGAGELGGEVVHSGDLESLRLNDRSVTSRYLTGKQRIPTPLFRRSKANGILRVQGARQHNLKNLTLEFPLGLLVCVTGVSGSGKSTLVNDVLYASLKKMRGEWKAEVGEHDQIEGWEIPSEVVLVDQNPIGKTPRSNPVTYVKAFDAIRGIFGSLREAQARNLTPGSFSFNIPGGRCETCLGAGTVTVEMQFLADVELTCEDCKGARYKSKTLEVKYRGRNIAGVLDMTVEEASVFFSSHAPVVRRLKVLKDVGLGYLKLGQSATTLSGGEAQRIKLASYLSKTTSRSPLFIFDEPTTGLHFDDINKLLTAFDRLITAGASVLVIEHNLDVIRSADWIIDLGPGGGEEGGSLVAQGPPEAIAEVKASHTGAFLKQLLANSNGKS
jgi:excinuclease ABC subunit A